MADLQLVLRLQVDGTGQVTAALGAVGQSLGLLAQGGDQAGAAASAAVGGVGSAAQATADQVAHAAASMQQNMHQLAQDGGQSGAVVARATRDIGTAAEASAGQTSMARRIVVTNLINMGQAAIVTRGNLIATLSPLPDLLYGISQMGTSAAATTRAMLGWGAAIAAVAGGLAVVIAHAATTEARTRSMTVALKAMGDSAGITGDQLRKMAEKAASFGPFSRSDTADAAKSMTSYASIPGSMYSDLLNTSVNFSAATNQNLVQGLNTLASALNQGYAGITKLDDAFGFLTREERNQIRTMADHGQQVEAMRVAMNALNRQFKGLADEGMGELGKSVKALKNEWSQLLDKAASSSIISRMMGGLTSGLRFLRGGGSDYEVGRQEEQDAINAILNNAMEGMEQSGISRSAATNLPDAASGNAVKLSAERLDALRAQMAQERRVLSAPGPQRSLVQAAVDAENQTNADKLLSGDAQELTLLKTSLAYQRIAASARDATDSMHLNADAQGRVAQAASISDIAMRHAAMENDVARFSYEHLGMGVEAYRQEAERAFANEMQGRRAQWAREINDQAAAADRLADAYRRGSVAAVDAAERENMIQAAIKQVGVSAEEAAIQVDKLFRHKWDQNAAQINRANDHLLAYGQSMEELGKAQETGILTDRAYAEQAQKNYREMLGASKEWEDGVTRAVLNYADEAGNAAKRGERFFSNAFHNMEDALVNFATTGKLQFNDLAQSILNDLMRMQIQASITTPLFKSLNSGSGFLGGIGALFGMGGGGGGGGGGGAEDMMGEEMLDWYDGLDAIVAHGGGVAGVESLRSASVARHIFKNAPRLHGGGLAGDEVPAILRRGEGVFTPTQMRHLAPVGAGAGGNQAVNITFSVQALDARGVSEAIYGQEKLIVAMIQRAFAKRGKEGPLK
ncbi:MAG: phage tail length tape measure family protein [Magnetococcus sp. DMHC-8]